MKRLGIIVCFVAGLGLSAQANTIQIGTGLNASGGLLSAGSLEQYYTTAGPNDNTAIAYVQPFYSGAWVANVATGQWISPVDNTTGLPSQEAPATFTYTRTIDGIGSMSGEFATDNPGELLVNGTVVSETPGWPSTETGDYQSFTTFSDIALNQAVNTIQFVVFNAVYTPDPTIPNPTGLIVSGTATIPDGGMTVSLLGLAVGACGLFARRMKKLA